MTKNSSVGIKRLEGIHWYVRDLERSRQFYTGKLDFAETWRSSPDASPIADRTPATPSARAPRSSTPAAATWFPGFATVTCMSKAAW